MVLERIKDKLVDRWITWRTGKSKKKRDLEAWYSENINLRADAVKDIFHNYKFVIEVDYYRFIDEREPFGYVPVPEARQYFYPVRDITNQDMAVWRIERVVYDRWNGGWVTNEMCGEDKIFVATNNEQDAVMIALLYA